eukprot:gnl/TRDRNA2_/TRDRNA2_80910_c0_seq1.p1 gnl/TRDRNA2_/TRDRNA2_80910_c0~~gnl/TRDRNA2_/TRDRNA2_80910_c0_seq1.p1  ORF type:complete len:220 (-),score=38.83 gnl/TRDRNA2_/TRDRNA2_80910_c0_seq1:138-797(-)
MPLLPFFSSSNEENSSPEPTDQRTISARARPWFIGLVTVQSAFVGLRWYLGDIHGALFMLTVVLVGILCIAFDDGQDIDIPYCKFYGILSFISGILDLAIGIEKLGDNPHLRLGKGHRLDVWMPVVHLACACIQLSSAFLCYLVCKDADDFEQEDGPFLATQEEARIYGAAMMHSQRRTGNRGDQPQLPPGVAKAFAGTAHKLPPTPQKSPCTPKKLPA